MEKHGFIYIWYDRKRKMYYIGCHYGTKNDGYICSNNRMRDAFRRRPNDFKRKIIETNITKDNLLEAEHKWLSMISEEELGKKYYNLRKHKWGHWSTDENKGLSIKEKISIKTKEAMSRPEVREKLIPVWENAKGKKQSQETIEKRAKANTGKKRSQVTKDKIGAAHRGNKHWLGKKHNEETITKLSKENNHFYGKTHSVETINKISAAQKGSFIWNNGTINKRSFVCPGEGWNKGRVRIERV